MSRLSEDPDRGEDVLAGRANYYIYIVVFYVTRARALSKLLFSFDS
jgi:hypothetical protein